MLLFRSVRLSIVLFAAFFSACATKRVVAPQISQPTSTLLGTSIENHPEIALIDLGKLSIANMSSLDSADDVRGLRQAFVNTANKRFFNEGKYWMRDRILRQESDNLGTRTASRTIDIHLIPEHDSSRTYVLDILYFAPIPVPLCWPFAPRWGDASLLAEVSIIDEQNRKRQFQLSVTHPYSMFLLTLVRSFQMYNDEIQTAYQATYTKAFELIAESLASGIPPPEQTFLKDESFHVVRYQPERNIEPIEDEPIFPEWLRALGGVEFQWMSGTASVQSTVNQERLTGGSETIQIASGSAASNGFRLLLNTPPQYTGFFLNPRVGFFLQDITITGIDETPKTKQYEGEDWPAIVHRADTGELLNAYAPLSYDLSFRSGYLGAAAGYHWVAENDWIRTFVTLLAGSNVFEVRDVEAQIFDQRKEGVIPVGLGAFQFAIEAGIAVLPGHFAIKGGYEFEIFRPFELPDSVEFRGPSTYNKEKNVFERKRSYVQEVSLNTNRGHLSLLVFF